MVALAPSIAVRASTSTARLRYCPGAGASSRTRRRAWRWSWWRALRAPLLVEKQVSLQEGPALFIDEVVTNTGSEAVDLMWGHHPALGAPFLDRSCVIDLPECQGRCHPVERFATQRLPPDQPFTWPIAPAGNGSGVDLSRVQPPGAGTADLVYLTDLPEGWCAVTNQHQQVSFGLAWTVEAFPHLWYWHDANGTSGYPWYGNGYVLALEPWSSYPGMGLAEAVARNTQITLQPGAQRFARLTAVLGTGMQRVERVTLDGTMVRQ
jgi:hypothetical protein